MALDEFYYAEVIKFEWMRGVDADSLHFVLTEEGYYNVLFPESTLTKYDEWEGYDESEENWDLSEEEIIDMLNETDEERYWGIFEPGPTWWDNETLAMSDHGYAKEMRRRRFHVLGTRVNLTENHPDARDRDDAFNSNVTQRTKRSKALCALSVEEGIREWNMQLAYEAYDYYESDPEIRELEAAYAYGDGSWEAFTPEKNPCPNYAMYRKLTKALYGRDVTLI